MPDVSALTLLLSLCFLAISIGLIYLLGKVFLGDSGLPVAACSNGRLFVVRVCAVSAGMNSLNAAT